MIQHIIRPGLCWGALFLLAGCGSAADGEEPAQPLAVRCEAGDALDCEALGTLYYEQRHDPLRARAYWERACSGGSGEGCFKLGALYAQGAGVEQDIQQALRLYLDACKLGSGTGCEALGSLYYEDRSVGIDQRQSAQFYAWGCRLGDALSCNEAGYQYDAGEGVTADRQQAIYYYRQACSHGLQLGCDNLEKLSAPEI